MNPPRGPAGSNMPESMAGYKLKQLPKFSPEQQQLFQQSFSHTSPGSFLSRLASGDQSEFAAMEAPAMRQFQDLMGQTASRFSGMGMGARHGSGFQNASSQATSDFAQDLAAKRLQTRMNAIRELMGFSESLLGQQPYETFAYPKKQKQGWGPAIGAAIGGLGGFAMGGPSGGFSGAQIGYGLGGGNMGGGGMPSFQSTPDWDFGDWLYNILPGGI